MPNPLNELMLPLVSPAALEEAWISEWVGTFLTTRVKQVPRYSANLGQPCRFFTSIAGIKNAKFWTGQVLTGHRSRPGRNIERGALRANLLLQVEAHAYRPSLYRQWLGGIM